MKKPGVEYHHDVVKKDIPSLSPEIAERAKKAIEQRISTEPYKYGIPLRKDLKGCWKLRIGDYRIIYQIKKGNVLILSIRHRSRVYEKIQNRLV